jgi:hypothetical protein
MIAVATARTVPNIMNVILYNTVFLIIIVASLVLVRNSKFFVPHQGLPYTPFAALYCLKAICIPNIGIYELINKYITPGKNIRYIGQKCFKAFFVFFKLTPSSLT